MFRRAPNKGIVVPADVHSMMRIEPMKRRHVRAVVAIEDRIFTRPWSAALYYSELAQPSTRRYFVAVIDGEVIGYIGCMLVVGEGHITTVGVAPEWHRRSIGTRLLLHLVRDVRALGATALTLEVRVTNTGAQELYRRFGFAPAGIRKNYYADVNEDAIVMWAHDVESEEYAARIEGITAGLDAPKSDGGARIDEGAASLDGADQADANERDQP